MQKAVAVLAIFAVALSADDREVFESTDDLAEMVSSHPRPPHPPHPPYPPRPPHRPHPLPPPPPYLKNVTSKARREFFAIVRNVRLTFAEQKERIKEWGEKYGISHQVEEFDAKMTKIKQEHRKNVTKLISELSGAQQKLSAIIDNENQTLIQLHQAIRTLTAKNPPLYHVLRFANFYVMRRPHRQSETVDSEKHLGHLLGRERAGGIFKERRVLDNFSHTAEFGADGVETSNSILSEDNTHESKYKMSPF